MGWVWRDDDESDDSFQKNPNYSSSSSGEVCSTRTVVRSQCKTEEVEPGKFVRKCEKTEEVLRDCLGKPVEVLKSNKEYTEDDVTEQVVRGLLDPGKFEDGPFDFHGLRGDIQDIERHFLGGINRFFEAAEEMKNNFFDVFGDFHNGNSSSSPSKRRGIPVEGHPLTEASPIPKEPNSGDVDLSGLARDV
ncbi:hypothetical protein NC652_036402 [Populus alba x Populus x berolinensis]|uniref:Mal d 1-associated protein n=2 Tax=Populus TaxID=3689 RepID=A0A8X8C8H6_POPTO|nr:hypothetical protein POTOM_051578 [Populus tomentosa]KAJ6863825.1 hypothetical protein NC651_034586 [Populus alba x Populus x berolinensis]KAJ6870737.1 hypothetical protein NC652_036402 [Populus alba x Populus x berolinensis]KAJ6968309.1 hypothetical protein NC653_036299 [Populus alba x Populus x berolinensis]